MNAHCESQQAREAVGRSVIIFFMTILPVLIALAGWFIAWIAEAQNTNMLVSPHKIREMIGYLMFFAYCIATSGKRRQ